MIQSKFKKMLFSLMLIFVMVFALGQNFIYAVKNGPITVLSSPERYIENGGVFTATKEYNIGMDTHIYQISSVNGTTRTAINFYCLNGELTPGNTYQVGYDMITEKNTIAGLTTAYSNTVSDEIYPQLMWIFDHMYIKGSMTVDEILAKAGIVYKEDGYYYDLDDKIWRWGSSGGYKYRDSSTSEIVDVKLSEDEVEAVQQAAIWYFTNYVKLGENKYNVYVEDGSSDGSASWLEFEETNDYVKKFKQEQAAILYNYLVDGAKKAKTDGYVSNNEGTLNFAFTDGEKIVKDGTNYKIGPVKITTTGEVDGLTLTVKTGEGFNQTINSSDVTLKNTSGTTITKLPVNQEFYVVVPRDKVNGSVKLDITGNTSTTTKILWVAETGGSTQPVVEYERNKTDLEKSLTVTPDTRLFDLALRKQIIKVNGGNTLVNENSLDATRTINPNTETIPDTATYNHRKDPIVVSTGDKVTYRIYIYNEGDIDGYASKIVDVLANGLKASNDMGATITSNKGNKYNVSTSGNKITLELTGTPVAISAYASTLDVDYVDVVCEVEQNPATDGRTKHYLSNIAYIQEAKDVDGNVVSQDRDGTESTPGNTNTANGTKGLNVTNRDDVYHGSTNKNIFNETNNTSDYFAGQEDDDDFETVVVLPKEFDLKLMKFISAINGEASGRTLTVDTSNLSPNGTKNTTADYQVSKVPITVETGDYITYTLRIYNEGEVSGYAEEITEDIPAGLEFVTEGTSEADTDAIALNNQYKWKVASRNADGSIKTVKSNYLSKATAASNLLDAYNGGAKPDYKDILITLKVTSTDVKNVIRNEAEISDDADENGNEVTDRDSVPEDWNKEDSDDLYENNPSYPKYKEDDEDYDNIKLIRFDLALRKFIAAVSTDGNFDSTTTTTRYNRAPQVDVSKLNTTDASGNLITTATYNHSKDPVVLDINSYVLYTIRVYNEGDKDGYAKEITDYLPTYLDFVDGTQFSEINSKWTYDATTRKVTTNALSTRKLVAFDGEKLDYADVQIICKVNETALSTKKITNIAEISQYADEDGDRDTDIDSTNDNLDYPDDESTYKDTEIDRGDTYIPGQEDDDDFEKVIIRGPGKYDVILIKEDENGEDLNAKATFEVNGVTKEVTGRLIIADDVVINASNVNTPDVYTIKETIPPDDYCTFDGIITITANKKTNGNTYSLDNLVYVVKDKDGNEMDTTDAKVYLKDGNIYVEVIDYEEKDFDLALRKFITNISGKDVTSRIPKVSYKDGKITYTHPKDVVKVHVEDVVTYTLRVFNEGELDGYAETISDDIPEYLEFLPEHEINKTYKWKMLDKDGKETTKVSEAVKIITDYTSRANGAEKNLLKAFDPNAAISDTNPAHLDVKVAFRVKDPKSNTYVIVNKAQISEDADEDGNPIDDIDSIPDKWNDGEDDQDYENVSVDYFDLSLLKYVTKVMVTENGKTTTRSTGNTGKDTDIIPKVEIHKKKIKTTVVKFEYTIKITNEGDIEGYAKEITDYVPKGLKFYASDNTGWKDEGNNVISTKLLENTLLKPGQSATVKVILRWINGESNLQTKINTAEISDDYNDEDVPDRDSVPDNKKPGEDDIDDAPVVLGIKTGLTENVMMYVGISLAILVVLGTGIILIKRFVL